MRNWRKKVRKVYNDDNENYSNRTKVNINVFEVYEKIISEKHAQGIALQQVPGNIQDVDMELEYGVMYYEFYILTEDSKRFKVKVDAKSGEILRVIEKKPEKED